ncbi:MAG: CHASE2 domain-containing protein [Candidatus Omnitrophota bacterium]|nr:CHASE2 domain-containing protein [Candidatus Omnitrophota bacterium]
MPKDKLLKYAAYLIGIFILSSFSFFRAFETYELQTLDLRFKLRLPLTVSPDIVIIEINEDTIKEFGRWPFSREYHAYLIDSLRQLGARAIVFDILFGEASPQDQELIEATENAKGLVYYPIAFKDEGKGSKSLLKSSEVEVALIKGLTRSAKGVGFINAVADIDGKIRRVPLTIDCKGKKYYHLTYLVAKDYLGKETVKVPLGDDGMTLINYPGKWIKTFKHYSFADVLISFKETVEGEKSIINVTDFYNKVCFIGQTEVGGHDLKPNPLEPAYPMVGVHASLFNSIIQNKFLVRADKVVNLILIFALCLVIALVANKARPVAGLGISAAVIFSFALISFILFVLFGLWIDLFCPLVLAAAVYLGVTVNRYLVEKRNRLLMEKELSIAKNIQVAFLPASVPQIEGIEIVASIETAKAIGGDLYDFTDAVAGQKKLGIMIGDVSGKGVPAALFMARAIADFRHFVNPADAPSRVLSELNKQIALNYKTGLFVTMFYMIYDSANKSLTFSNGGHLPAIWLKSDGTIELLKTEGMPLGLIDSETYSDGVIKLSPEDTIVLYTDGVTEARNSEQEEFGDDRLKDAVFESRGLSAASMADNIKKRLNKFVGTVPQYDDCTFIVFKIKE